jgi:hypothetical protein
MSEDVQPKTEYVRFCLYEEAEVDGRFVATYAMEDAEN